MPITPTTNSTYDSTLPQTPDFSSYQQKLSANPYQQGDSAYDIFNAYQSYLGRDPEAGIVSQRANDYAKTEPVNQQIQDIQNSGEAQTYGRARNEINTQVDSQIQNYYQQAAIEQQKAQNQLRALDPKYQAEFNTLDYGLNSNQQEIQNQLATLGQDYDVNSGRLGAQLNQIPLQAFQMANRRGLLDSSITYDTLGRLAQPVQNSLSDLTRNYQQNQSAAQQKLQSIVEKYNLDKGNLTSQREQEAQGYRDQYSTALAQYQAQAALANSQRGAQVNAQAGNYNDALKNFLLQQQSVNNQNTQFGQTLAENQRQYNQNYALQQAAAGKL